MLVSQTTIRDNQAGCNFNDGGALLNWGNNDNLHGTVGIADSTISGNSASAGGGVVSRNDVSNLTTIESSTIADNTAGDSAGAGIRADAGTIEVAQTIVTHNVSLDVLDNCDASGGTITSIIPPSGPSGYNLADDHSCGFTATGDIEDATPPLVASLADNGGPTDTQAIDQSSPAFDGVGTACPSVDQSVDQRGITRPQGAACDIGAFELEVTAPANDDFAGAITVSGASGATTGTNVNATEEAGEPGVAQPLEQAQENTNNTVWWKWVAPGTGSFEFDTFGSGFDTVMGIFTSSGSGVANLAEIGSNDDADSTTESKVGFHAVSGTTYYVQVGGFQQSGEGPLTLNWGPGIPNDSFLDATPLSGDSGSLNPSNAGATTELHENVPPPNGPDFTGGDIRNSIWFAYAPSKGGVVTVTQNSQTNSSLGVYVGSSIATLTAVANDYDNTPLSVQFNVTGGTTYWIQVGSYFDPPGPFALTWSLATSAPTLSDTGSQNVAANSADAVATINPNGDDTTYTVHYGTTTNYDNQTAAVDIGAGFSSFAASRTIGGLKSSTTYHFQFVATNGSGTTVGPDASFTTTGRGAQSFTVTTNADNVDDANCQPSSCTLRQAIERRRRRDGTDTITVPAGSYQLSANFGALIVDNGMTIDGAGARDHDHPRRAGGRPRAGRPRVRPHRRREPGLIQGVTLTGGTATPSNGFFGGDVRSPGNLTLRHDTITGGSAYSGGGLSNFGGTMLVDRTTVSGNQAASGGADSGGIQNWGNSATRSTAR